MKKSIISTLLVLIFSFILVSCGSSADNSEDIASAFDREECERTEGFWNGSKCFNPCKDNPCGIHGKCKNTGEEDEDYKCKCENGYAVNSDNECVDIDECADQSKNDCNNAVSTCANEEGTYSCICKENYSGKDCVPNKRMKECKDLPENAEWNEVDEIEQTWNGEEWAPSAKGSYNEESSETECRFKCEKDYHWENSLCVSNTKTDVECTGLPQNATWNTASSITQTWDGSSWQPSNIGVYNETASTEECRYKCDSDSHRENSLCVSNTRTSDCTSKPENTVWNDNGADGTYTQTWSSSNGWSSYSSSYSTSAGVCKYKCDSTHTWEDGSCINQKTSDCPSKPENTVWNDNGADGTYTQTWSSSSGWNSYSSSYSTSAGICRYKCDSTHTWEGGSCINQKTVSCPSKPANSTWNGDSTYTQNWSDSSWTPVYPLKNSGTAGACRFVCNEGYNYNGSTCVVPLTIGNICTGLNKCYDNGKEITCPAPGEDFFGQDAQYAASGSCTPQSFAVIETGIENENIVQDLNTWLQWQQTPSTETFTWDDAVAYCESLDYGGHDDWRLPSPNEFLTIADNSKYGPAIDKTYFVSMPSSNYFWTSKTYSSSEAFYFRSNYSTIFYTSRSNMYRAMCVRGNELPTGSFTTSTAENGDITVTDSVTGLIWQKTYVSSIGWLEALEYCEKMDYAGYTDWRLPNINELASLLNYDKSTSPYSDFPDMLSSRYLWSSSTQSNTTGNAWLEFFSTGGKDFYGKNNHYFVRCVRSDICENGKFWNGSQCVNNPCEANSCNHTHETGNCQPRTVSTFECNCESGYFWNGSTCVSPCDSHSCGSHSDGNCTALSLDVFYCGCVDGYSWNAGECKEYSTGLSLGNICTGQNKCYDNSSAEIECPDEGEDFFGQDAQYAALGYCTPQSFTVVDTGIANQNIVQDNNTNLQWQQTPSTEAFTWKEAYIHCDTLNYGGYSDWRLPTTNEFHTISDNSRSAPAVDTTYFPNITDSNHFRFWTSQERKVDTTKAYYVRFDIDTSGIETKTIRYNVMCVRGNELPKASFTTQTIAGKVVVNDSTTGLMWQKEYSENTWVNALKYCENLVYAGYDDWRLPNKNEVASLLNYAGDYSDFSFIFFNYNYRFRSSSTAGSLNGSANAFGVYFNEESVTVFNKSSQFSIRCVR